MRTLVYLGDERRPYHRQIEIAKTNINAKNTKDMIKTMM